MNDNEPPLPYEIAVSQATATVESKVSSSDTVDEWERAVFGADLFLLF